MTTPRTSVDPASAAPSAVMAGMPGLCSADAAIARARASAFGLSARHSPPRRTSGWVAAASARSSSTLISRPPSDAFRS